MADLWHRMLHKHVLASKPGVGDLLICTHRFTGTMGIHVMPDDMGEPITLHDREPGAIGLLACSVSAQNLRENVDHLMVCRIAHG